jgi:inactivated superfamily I helicase
MLAHLRYLRKAIQVLTVNGEISAIDLSEEQKCILDESEALLKPTAKVQHLLEGDKYPTISLVAYFLHHIRVVQCEKMANDTNPSSSVSTLAQKLLDDFEKSYLKRNEPVFASHI